MLTKAFFMKTAENYSGPRVPKLSITDRNPLRHYRQFASRKTEINVTEMKFIFSNRTL